MFFVDQIVYKVSANLNKISILFNVKRIFVGRTFHNWCYGLITLVGMYSLASIIATIWQCQPVSFAYDSSDPHGQCMNLTAFWLANSVYNIVTDFVVWISPLPIIYRLMLPRVTKIRLAILFSIGLL